MGDSRYEKNYRLPDELVLERLSDQLRSFYIAVAGLIFLTLLLILVVPGFATDASTMEPFVRNIIVLAVIGLLYLLVDRGHVDVAVFLTITVCMVISTYTVFKESPGNMQMLALVLLPTALAGFLPRRSQFWSMYALNVVHAIFTVWLIITYRNVELEFRSIVTLILLLTLLALLIDTIGNSYRQSLLTTFNQLNQIRSAHQRLVQMDEDLGVAVNERIRAETYSDQLATTGRLALEATGAGSVTIDLHGGSVSVSTEFTTYFGLGESPETFNDLVSTIHPDDRTRFTEMIAQAGALKRLDGDFRMNTSAPCWWMFVMETDSQETGSLEKSQKLHGVAVDVTSRVVAQRKQDALDDQTRESQRLESLGVLAGSLAHDFNNLLHVIMLNADLARQNLNPDSKSATSLDRLMVTVDRAAELCSELLAYSGRGQFSIERFELEKLVREMRSLLDLSTPKGVTTYLRTDDSNPVIEGDITQIRQVVMNLITNAGEAIGSKSGEVNIFVDTKEVTREYLQENSFIEDIPDGYYARFSIEDNGGGMSASTRQKIFDPFFSTKPTGHGLGLSAVIGIVRSHRGSLAVQSTEGHGTRFTILLPLVDSLPLESEKPITTTTQMEVGGLILFADDEEDIRKLAVAVLEESGYELLEATDGDEAVALFKKHQNDLDLVILDIMMPGKTGLEAYFEISELGTRIPIVFSSGFNENDALQKLPQKTRSGFLKKPYLAEDLRRFVDNLIGARDAHR